VSLCVFQRRFIHLKITPVVDIAKRLMDMVSIVSTVSSPVKGTMMIEPTESESKEEMIVFVKLIHKK
jgi:glycine cleavage system protein P-like pyridoxal-binding family